MKKLIFILLMIPFLSNVLMAQCNTAYVHYDFGNQCTGNIVFFGIIGNNPPVSAVWHCPDGNCPPGFNPNILYPSFTSSSINEGGIYSVIITDNLNCVSSSQVIVTITPTPQVSISGPFSICEGTPLTCQSGVNNDPNGFFGPYTYLWDGGQTTKDYVGNAVGAGAFGPAPSVKVTNSYGCSAYNNTTYFFAGYARPTVTVSANGLIKCDGSTSNLTVTPTGGTLPYTYQWYTNNTLNGSTGVTYSTVFAGTYKVLVTDSRGCTRTSANKVISFVPKPIAQVTAENPTSFCVGGNVKLFGSIGNGYTYKWLKNGAAMSGAVANNYVATIAGNYSVRITDINLCTSTSVVTAVTVPCRGAGQPFESDILNELPKVFPVPVKDVFTIDTKNITGKGFIYIINSMGQNVYTLETDFDLKTSQKIDMGSFANGIYTIALKNTDGTEKVSIVKE